MNSTLRNDLAIVDEVAQCAEIAKALSLKTAAGTEYLRFALAGAMLFDRKQQDYGPHNILKFGTYGVLMRMNDKFERLVHLFGQKRKKAVNEPLVDSFRDISVYGNIALMVESGRWT